MGCGCGKLVARSLGGALTPFARQRAQEPTGPTVEVLFSGEGTRTYRAMGQLYKFGTDDSHRLKRIDAKVAVALAEQPGLAIVEGSLVDPSVVPEEPEELEQPAEAPVAEEPQDSEDEDKEEAAPPAPVAEEVPAAVEEPAPAPVPAPKKRTRRSSAQSA